jgi:HPt (histidine-containing phosphotransfer) domain-containing protein
VAQTFDEPELLDRVDNDLGFLAETVEMLAADAPPLLDELAGAVEARDAAAVGRLAHSLKGMISNFCAPAAQGAALDLERLGKAGDLSGAGPALLALRERVGALSAELAGFVKARS